MHSYASFASIHNQQALPKKHDGDKDGDEAVQAALAASICDDEARRNRLRQEQADLELAIQQSLALAGLVRTPPLPYVAHVRLSCLPAPPTYPRDYAR